MLFHLLLQILTLTFNHFRLEPQDLRCEYDYLQVFDGGLDYSNLLVTFCRTRLPADVSTTGYEATLRFHSDGLGEFSGFSLNYTATVPTEH